MRGFSKTPPDVWFQEIEIILESGGTCNEIALYYFFTTCPMADRTGIYQVSLETISRRLGHPLKGVQEGVKTLSKAGIIYYDYKYEYVWVKKMAIHQLGLKLSEKDNNIAYFNNYLLDLPKVDFIHDFIDMYGANYHLNIDNLTSKFNVKKEGGLDPVLSTRDKETGNMETGNKETMKQETGERDNIVGQPEAALLVQQAELVCSSSNPVVHIFEFWRRTLGKGDRVHLSDARKRLIAKAIKIYGVEDCELAIINCAKSEFHMGKNPEGKIHDAIDLIFRDSKHIEMFRDMGKRVIFEEKSADQKRYEEICEMADRYEEKLKNQE